MFLHCQKKYKGWLLILLSFAKNRKSLLFVILILYFLGYKSQTFQDKLSLCTQTLLKNIKMLKLRILEHEKLPYIFRRSELLNRDLVNYEQLRNIENLQNHLT